jgi:hypothetical protein
MGVTDCNLEQNREGAGCRIGGHVLNRAGGHPLESGHLFPFDSAPCQSGGRGWLQHPSGPWSPGRRNRSLRLACLGAPVSRGLTSTSLPWSGSLQRGRCDRRDTTASHAAGSLPVLGIHRAPLTTVDDAEITLLRLRHHEAAEETSPDSRLSIRWIRCCYGRPTLASNFNAPGRCLRAGLPAENCV